MDGEDENVVVLPVPAELVAISSVNNAEVAPELDKKLNELWLVRKLGLEAMTPGLVVSSPDSLIDEAPPK